MRIRFGEFALHIGRLGHRFGLPVGIALMRPGWVLDFFLPFSTRGWGYAPRILMRGNDGK